MRLLPYLSSNLSLCHRFLQINRVHIRMINGISSNLLRNLYINKLYNIFDFQKRFYRPDWLVDWVRIKQRWRTQQIINKKAKHKNHTRVRLRFRLTRFGWERLSAKRHGIKYNMNDKQYRNTMKIKYVHRNDMKNILKQLPGYKLRLRDPPLDPNPNIQKSRRCLGSYFG